MKDFYLQDWFARSRYWFAAENSYGPRESLIHPSEHRITVFRLRRQGGNLLSAKPYRERCTSVVPGQEPPCRNATFPHLDKTRRPAPCGGQCLCKATGFACSPNVLTAGELTVKFLPGLLCSRLCPGTELKIPSCNSGSLPSFLARSQILPCSPGSSRCSRWWAGPGSPRQPHPAWTRSPWL